ncbi:MAG: DUF2946 domain-containing protein [Lysobacterales bacterium]|nr:MAG: DUF2946 domain-containing protein [Xanthomonadales bacterium]
MRRPRVILVFLACTALLLAQGLGLHHHVDGDGQGLGLQTTHANHADSSDHDHGGQLDASKLELGNVWAKVFALFALPASLFVLAPLTANRNPPPPAMRRKARRRPHWRPFLRAPPTTA